MAENEDQQYIEHRSLLVAGLRDSYAQFDKAILLLSGGTIIISLTVVKDIVPPDSAKFTWLVVWSWITLVSSLISIVSSFVTSQHAFSTEIKNWDEYCDGKEDCFNKRNIWSGLTTALNIGAMLLFLSGVILLLVFVFKNLNLGA